ncbi:MAG: hypothetical protein ABIV26_05705 [Candidatus Limnocylindrales bacterium]
MSHPSLGHPPRDLSAGHPDAAAMLVANRSRVAARALEAAVDGDPTFRSRYSDLALRELLADTEAMADRLGVAIASGEADVLGEWAEMVAPRYRKRNVPMDDMIRLAEALDAAAEAVIHPAAAASARAATDAAVAVFRWHRRLAGDARKRNPILAFLYKGA